MNNDNYLELERESLIDPLYLELENEIEKQEHSNSVYEQSLKTYQLIYLIGAKCKNIDQKCLQRTIVEVLYHSKKGQDEQRSNWKDVGVGIVNVVALSTKAIGKTVGKTEIADIAETASNFSSLFGKVRDNSKEAEKKNAALHEGQNSRKEHSLNQDIKNQQGGLDQKLQLFKQAVESKSQFAAMLNRSA